MRLGLVLGILGGVGLGCADGPAGKSPAETESESESESVSESESESGDAGFDPMKCGDWDWQAPASPGELPPVESCAPGPACPHFVEISVAAGLATKQYRPTAGNRYECIFDWFSGDGVVPNADCDAQWFTGGAAVEDIDGDGDLDLFVTRLAAPDLMYVNDGSGRFHDEAVARGLADCTYSSGAVFGDIDNDGDADLLVGAVGTERHFLYLNDGNGYFTEAAVDWGFDLEIDGRHAAQSITLGDYDLDGRLDAHINAWIEPHNYSPFEAPGPHGARLLHNVGGRFEDVTEAQGVSLLGINPKGIYGYASAFADLDDDGWPELVVAADFASSRLFWNEGGNFVDGTASSGFNRESNAMGLTIGDYDLDGRPDIFVTSIGERNIACPDECPWKGTGNRLYKNWGSRIFSVEQDSSGTRDADWAWGTAFLDYDNDGDLDLYAVNGWPGNDLNGGNSHEETPARLWRNRGDGVMDELAGAAGVDDREYGRAVLPFDIDGDGDLDLFVTNHVDPPRLFRNDGGDANAWIEVMARGSTTNRDGRGVKVEVQLDADGPWQRREIGVGSHFLGQGPARAHFGLGPGATTIHQLRLTWPASGTVQVFDQVEVRQRLVVEEPAP